MPLPEVPSNRPARHFEFEPRNECPCGATLIQPRRITREYAWGVVEFAACPKCRSWIQSPQITVQALTRWYNSEDYRAAGASKDGIYLNYSADEAARRGEASARYRRDLHKRLKPGSRVLEVGCATGSLLAALRDAGHQVSGLELSSEFAEEAKRLNGLDVLVGDFARMEYAPKSFDAILMLGTVSNLQHSEHHFRRVRELLKPGGLFYFNTPLANSFSAWIYGRNFWMFAPSVSTFFSRKGCELSMQRAGFEAISCKQDYQRPTIGKWLGHLRLKVLFPLARKIGIAEWAPPISIPIPSVSVWVAQNP